MFNNYLNNLLRLMNHALDKAAADNSVSKQYLNDVAPGPVKRQMIDDVTIMIIDLENQI